MSLKNESFLPPVVYVQFLSGLNFGSLFQAFSGEAWRRPEHTSDSWDVRLFYTIWGHKHDIYIYIYIYTLEILYTYKMCVYNLYIIQNEKTGN